MAVTLNDIKALFRKVIIPLHTIERDTTLPLPGHRPDNDAEHSWSLTFLALSLAPEVDNHLDTGKIAILAAVHDIVEVYAGDTSVWADTDFADTKHARETAALKKLKTDLPAFPAVFQYVDEYEAKNSNEAKFVYALDKFLNMLTIGEDNGYYYHKHKITKARYDAHLKDHRLKAHTHPVVAKYYDELRELFDSNPNHFYTEN